MEVKLSNGNIIKDVELNGNNFIPKILDKSMFVGGLDEVIIVDKDTQYTLYDQKIQFGFIGDVKTFILMDKTPEDKLREANELLKNQLELLQGEDLDNKVAITEIFEMLI